MFGRNDLHLFVPFASDGTQEPGVVVEEAERHHEVAPGQGDAVPHEVGLLQLAAVVKEQEGARDGERDHDHDERAKKQLQRHLHKSHTHSQNLSNKFHKSKSISHFELTKWMNEQSHKEDQHQPRRRGK